MTKDRPRARLAFAKRSALSGLMVATDSPGVADVDTIREPYGSLPVRHGFRHYRRPSTALGINYE